MSTWNKSAQDRVTGSQDIIDSRDVIAAIEELSTACDCVICGQRLSQGPGPDDPWTDVDGETACPGDAEGARKGEPHEVSDESDAVLLQDLEAFSEEGADTFSDWRHGVGLVSDGYWEQYARDTADDLHGNEMRSASWPFDCIDWERAARELQQDYSTVEFEGVTYWGRS